MNQPALPLHKLIGNISQIIIDGETHEVSIRYGDYIQKYSAQMCSISIRPETNSSGSAALRIVASPATPPCSPANTSAESLSPSWIDWRWRFWTTIQTSLSVSVILLFGLWGAGLASLSFVGLLNLVLIAWMATNFYLPTIQPRSSDNGNSAPPPSQT